MDNPRQHDNYKMQHPIPDPSYQYTIDDDLVVRNLKGREVQRRTNYPHLIALWGGVPKKLTYFNVEALLAWARDGVPISPKPPKPSKPRKLLGIDRNGVRTLTLRHHWDELRKRAGLPPFEYQ